mmetsp:Transcript_58548/g.151322  ORF Transcript_58548/g.151322 Transcript_58548/m.151322 type:complete len:176 (+) Transcript_58548:1120-1647(+)
MSISSVMGSGLGFNKASFDFTELSMMSKNTLSLWNIGTTKYFDKLKTSVTMGSNWVCVRMPSVIPCLTKCSWIFSLTSADSVSVGFVRLGHQKRGITAAPPVTGGRFVASRSRAGAGGIADPCRDLGEVAGPEPLSVVADVVTSELLLLSRSRPLECGLPGGDGRPDGEVRKEEK